MIKIGDVEYRNVQEQVAKNASDIKDLQGGVDNLGEELAAEKEAREDADAGLTQDVLTLQNAKQDKLTAGTGIDITSNVISATSGGRKLYFHNVYIHDEDYSKEFWLYFVSTRQSPCTTSGQLQSLCRPLNPNAVNTFGCLVSPISSSGSLDFGYVLFIYDNAGWIRITGYEYAFDSSTPVYRNVEIQEDPSITDTVTELSI